MSSPFCACSCFYIHYSKYGQVSERRSYMWLVRSKCYKINTYGIRRIYYFSALEYINTREKQFSKLSPLEITYHICAMQLKARKDEQQNTTRSATMLPNELCVDVARFTTPVSNWSGSKNTKLGW